MKPIPLFFVALWVTGHCQSAMAEGEVRARARLRFFTDAGAACPDENRIREGVAARLGYDPFTEGADREVWAIITRAGQSLRARVEMRDAEGNVVGEKELAATHRDCAELSRAVEFAIALAIDPLIMASGGEGSASPPESRPAQRAAARTMVTARPVQMAAPSPASPSAAGLGFFAAVGALGAFGSSPGPAALGVTVQAGLRRRWLSLALELRGDLPTSAASGGGSIRSWLALASVLPCAHRGLVAGCLVLGAGVLGGSGQNLTASSTATLPLVVAGARLALNVPLPRRLSLSVHGDLLVPLIHAVFQVSHADAWAVAPVAGALGCALARSW